METVQQPGPTSEPLSTLHAAQNEEATLAHCVHSIRESSKTLALPEVVVADGGSADGTVALARSIRTQVVRCNAGRGTQMNAGVHIARGSTLLFLHADCQLPPGWQAAVETATRPQGKAPPPRWGCFQSIQLDRPGFRAAVLRHGVAMRTRYRHTPYGDQAIFVDRAAFMEVGGYEQWRILEDVELVVRLRKKYGCPAIIPLPVQVSARRWQRLGFFRTFVLNQCILGAWHCGVSPDTLANWYYPTRAHRPRSHCSKSDNAKRSSGKH